MPKLEIHPLSGLRDEAAALLRERFDHQKAAEPLLPDIDDFEPHLPEAGHVATRGGHAVAYLAGMLDDDMARWQFAGHAARETEALRDLFALQVNELGVSRFMVSVPATAPELVDTWFRLGFGQQAVWAVQDVTPVEPPAFAGTVRPSTLDDLEAVLDLDEVLFDALKASPSLSELQRQSRDELRAEEVEMWTSPKTAALLAAEVDGRVVGFVVLYHRPEGDLRVPAQNVDLAFAATREDVRGSGAGVALFAESMRWAKENGFRSMTTDWREGNLPASRFWPRRGFRPQYLRLYRAVP